MLTAPSSFPVSGNGGTTLPARVFLTSQDRREQQRNAYGAGPGHCRRSQGQDPEMVALVLEAGSYSQRWGFPPEAAAHGRAGVLVPICRPVVREKVPERLWER